MDEAELAATLQRPITVDDAFWGALSEIGAARRVEFETQVRTLLSHDNVDVREDAIATLAVHWRLASFEQECVLYTFEDPNPQIREVAMRGVVTYNAKSGNTELAQRLFSWLQDQTKPFTERSVGVFGIPHVLGGAPSSRGFLRLGLDIRTHEGTEAEFQDLLPLAELREMIDKHLESPRVS